MSDDVMEGGKVAVRSSDGKTINVRGSDLLFEGDAAAVDIDGYWMLPRRLGSKSEGRVMQQHVDGSVSVQLQGLLADADLNGFFGHVCGACDAASQRWPVRVTLPDGDTKDMSLKADNLVCSRQVMARDGNGGLCAVPAFASGWLTRQRPGAKVLRFRREDVEGVRAAGVLADVTDDLHAVAAAVGSSGLVEVNEATRTLGMHQLLQQAVRAELGDAHDDAMAALLEARCSCMGDADDVDERMYSVM